MTRRPSRAKTAAGAGARNVRPARPLPKPEAERRILPSSSKRPGGRGCADLDPMWPGLGGEPRGFVSCATYPNCSCGAEDKQPVTAGHTDAPHVSNDHCGVTYTVTPGTRRILPVPTDGAGEGEE
jgi:hypothetical protein